MPRLPGLLVLRLALCSIDAGLCVVDTSPAHEALALARGEYHAALATLRVDPLSLACAA